MSFLRKLFLLDTDDEQDNQAEERARIEGRLAKEREWVDHRLKAESEYFEDRLAEERVTLKQEILQQVRNENKEAEHRKNAEAIVEMRKNDAFDHTLEFVAKPLNIEPEILKKVRNTFFLIRVSKQFFKSPEVMNLVDLVTDGALKEKMKSLSPDHSPKVEQELFNVFYKHLTELGELGDEIMTISSKLSGSPMRLLMNLMELESKINEVFNKTKKAYQELTSLGIDALLKGDLLDIKQVNAPAVERRAASPFSSGPFMFSSVRDGRSSDSKEEKTPSTPRLG